jgi:hypothetical protein
MAPPRGGSTRIRDIIIKARLIDELQLKSALGRQAQWGGRLPRILVDMGMVNEEVMTEALSRALSVPVHHLGNVVKDPAALSRIDETTCTEQGVFPLQLKERSLVLAMADPTDIATIDGLQAKLGVRITPVLAAESEITAAIARHYRGDDGRATAQRAQRSNRHEVPMSGEAQIFELDTSPPPPTSEHAQPAPGSFMSRPPSANTMLDEMFGEDEGGPSTDGFTEEELVRLDAARLNQQKTHAILTAVEALLSEKGFR